MKQKNLLTFTLILTVIFILVVGTGYAQIKPVKKTNREKNETRFIKNYYHYRVCICN